MKNRLYVKYHDRLVGILALTKEKNVVFEYSQDWLENGFSINPFSLPLVKKVFVPTKHHFNGLFGVFADSLPDSWGELLLERYLRNKLNEEINVIDRLAIIGSSGMGALEYEPEIENNISYHNLSLDEINFECGKILSNETSKELDNIFKLGGSSGGARPKVLMNIDGRNWLIKFSNHIDHKDSGLIEYEYSLCAKKCGINVPEVKLFESNLTSGYFGIERFDIKDNKKVHMVSVAGLLELDFRSPCMDYTDLIKLTAMLTNNSDVYEMYRRMCFNVFSHNRDDHTKNVTFIYDEENKMWKLSPAYDLTYSNTYFGEHTTSVNGKGTNITDADLLTVGLKNNLAKDKCINIINEIKSIVNKELKKYLK